MKLSTFQGNVENAPVDVIALGVKEGSVSKSKTLTTLDKALKGALKDAAKEQDFTGKNGQLLSLKTLGNLRAKYVVLIGLGQGEGEAAPALSAAGAITRAGNRLGAKSALVAEWPGVDNGKSDELLELAGRGALLGGYRFLEYKNDAGRKPTLTQIKFALPDNKVQRKQSLDRSTIIADAVCTARDLVNTTANDLFPESFAKRVTTLARKNGISVKVLKPDQLKRMKMNLLLGVGAGSTRTPRLVHMTYMPKSEKAKKKKPIVLVGKGITFDSGGLSLKPSASMVDMKIDMAGAAAVTGTLEAVARLKVDRPVHGILALAENMPSGTAIRPGDVIRGASGKTVEINNTDAEGRLVLADALNYATTLKPAVMVDLATLTGACMVALGPYTVGMFSNDDTLAEKLRDSAQRTGEDFWRMPLTETLKEQLRSDVADMRNTGERWGGAITAALFLKEFVGNNTWAHLDIAGPASSSKDNGAVSKGGTGVGVATLVDWISRGA